MNSYISVIQFVFIIMVFLGGLYFYTKYNNPKMLEGLTTMNGQLRCPNILIQKDAKFYLYNSNNKQVPGVNPIVFNNLEEYVTFIEWQRSVGIRCPVLYVQNSYDAQGNRVYKMRPSVTEPQGGLPPAPPSSQRLPNPLYIPSTTDSPQNTLLVDAGRNDPPYNTNSYPAYDQTGYYIGKITPLDTMKPPDEVMLYANNDPTKY